MLTSGGFGKPYSLYGTFASPRCERRSAASSVVTGDAQKNSNGGWASGRGSRLGPGYGTFDERARFARAGSPVMQSASVAVGDRVIGSLPNTLDEMVEREAQQFEDIGNRDCRAPERPFAGRRKGRRLMRGAEAGEERESFGKMRSAASKEEGKGRSGEAGLRCDGRAG